MRFVGGDRFDIAARLPEGTGPEQVPSMLRTLLADRFKLTVHTEARDAPVYALVLARNDGKLGARLRKAPVDCEANGTILAGADASGAAASAKQDELGRCKLQVGGEIFGRGQRLGTLARTLSLFTDAPVIDRTALEGGYDFDLQFPELETSPDAVAPRTERAGGIFTALREQLGLKLQPGRSKVDFLIIDGVAHPTAD